MALFSLMAKLGLDVSEFQTGLKRAESSASTFGPKLKSYLAGAFSVGAVTSMSKAVLDYAGNIVDLAEAYDLTTAQIQKMQEVASRNGVELDRLTQATVKITEARKKATDGDVSAFNAFSRLGISIDQLSDKNLSSYDLLIKVAEASSKSARTFEDQAAMVDLLGGKSVRLVGALRELATVEPLALVSQEQLETLDKYGNKAENILTTLKRIGVGYAGFVGQAAETRISLQLKALDLALSRFGIKPSDIIGAFNAKPSTPAAVNPATGMPEGYTPFGRATGEQFGPEVAPKVKVAKERSRFDRPSTGSLASIGGLYFGADYNTRLMNTAEKQVRELEKISTNTKDAAESLKQ